MTRQFEFVKAEQRSPEWFALRADGITATDASVIAGVNPYKTPFQLWAEKLGKYEPEPVGAAAIRGLLLEATVAEFYQMETGRKLKRSNGIVRIKDIPWAMASLDRTVVGEDGLVEIKTSTSPRWSLHPVPPEVVAQVQWQMLVTNAPWCDVAVLLGGLVFRIERVKPDPSYQAHLYRKAEEFRELLATQTPPTLQGEDSDALAKVVKQESEDWAQSSPGLDRVASLYSEKLYEAKLLDQELQNLAISLKEAIGDKQGIVGEGWRATWRTNKGSAKTDWKAVAEVAKVPQEIIDANTREVPGARVFKFKEETDL